jgi:4-hydroxy-3-methylbut-2-en-1-yl diphosphate reductase
MKILLAEHLGMCFGVRDAIELAMQESAVRPLTVLGDLVHNETVLTQLRSRGVQFQNDVASVATPQVMITAHGASEQRVAAVRERGLRVVEATCPLVQAAHRAVARLVQAGFHPVIIGQRQHVEVRGITEDLAAYDVVLTAEDVAQLGARAKYGVAAQTTQPIERVRELVQLIRERFPQAEVRFVDTVCQPTKQRQHAAVALARQCDVVVVIGGAHSNNTRELVRSCGQFCARVHHVQTAADLRREWFQPEDTAGLTAGTSTPDEVIHAVQQQLQQFAGTAKTANIQLSHELATHAL